jgi:hypothetical protein
LVAWLASDEAEACISRQQTYSGFYASLVAGRAVVGIVLQDARYSLTRPIDNIVEW